MTDLAARGIALTGVDVDVDEASAPAGTVAGTVPYPWPYDAARGLVPHRIALVVAGAQARWTTDAAAVLDRIETLAAMLRDSGVLVVFVRHARPALPRRRRDDLPVARTRAWELACESDPRDLIVDTHGCDGFASERLDLELRSHRRDHLLIAGLAAEVLVDSTMRSANDRGYECLVLDDASHPLSPDTGARVLSSVTMSGGIFGAVGSSDAVLAALAIRTEPDSTKEQP